LREIATLRAVSDWCFLTPAFHIDLADLAGPRMELTKITKRRQGR
jgi:hypothetical protein